MLYLTYGSKSDYLEGYLVFENYLINLIVNYPAAKLRDVKIQNLFPCCHSFYVEKQVPFHIEEDVLIDNVFKNRTKSLKSTFY